MHGLLVFVEGLIFSYNYNMGNKIFKEMYLHIIRNLNKIQAHYNSFILIKELLGFNQLSECNIYFRVYNEIIILIFNL